MKQIKKKKSILKNEVKVEQILEADKLNELCQFIVSESQKQSKERKLRNELLAIQFQMEDYIEREEIENPMRILDFVKLYLKTLNLSQKDLASIFEMKDTNLYKYLVGDRKLNSDLVLKLSYFLHTPPEIWYYLQTKNDLNELTQASDIKSKYGKYDYRKTVLAKSKR